LDKINSTGGPRHPLDSAGAQRIGAIILMENISEFYLPTYNKTDRGADFG